MSGSTRRPREEEILDQARELFSERGYRETTLQDIADRLGITRPAFYYYFKSKEEILWKLVRELGFNLLDQARPIAASQDPPQRKLGRILERHVDTVLRDTDTFKVYFSSRDRLDGEKSRQLREGEHTYARLVAEVISEGQALGVMRPGNSMVHALLVIGLANSVVRWFHSAGEMSIEDIAAEVSETAVEGLSATDR